MLGFLHLAGTSGTAGVAANGEDSCLSVFTFMLPVTRTIVSRPEALVTCTRISRRLINLELLSSLCPLGFAAQSNSLVKHVDGTAANICIECCPPCCRETPHRCRIRCA